MYLLNEKKVSLHVDVVDWKEAIRAAGQLLVNVGAVEPRYIEAIIDNVMQYGPYFVLAPGVAMPHASCTSGVNHVDVSVITLKNEINFLDSPNSPVKLVICLAATDNVSHMELLKKVSEVLSDEQCVERVKQAVEIQEVLSIFNS